MRDIDHLDVREITTTIEDVGLQEYLRIFAETDFDGTALHGPLMEYKNSFDRLITMMNQFGIETENVNG